jgi:hypothetical protein
VLSYKLLADPRKPFNSTLKTQNLELKIGNDLHIEKGNESVKERKSIPIFKGRPKRRNLNYSLILIGCKNICNWA